MIRFVECGQPPAPKRATPADKTSEKTGRPAPRFPREPTPCGKRGNAKYQMLQQVPLARTWSSGRGKMRKLAPYRRTGARSGRMKRHHGTRSRFRSLPHCNARTTEAPRTPRRIIRRDESHDVPPEPNPGTAGSRYSGTVRAHGPRPEILRLGARGTRPLRQAHPAVPGGSSSNGEQSRTVMRGGSPAQRCGGASALRAAAGSAPRQAEGSKDDPS